MSRRITNAQQAVLDFVALHLRTVGIPPSRAEIARARGFSLTAAQQHLRALAKKGVLELIPGCARGIRLVRPPATSG
jgi:repressor LexA